MFGAALEALALVVEHSKRLTKAQKRLVSSFFSSL